MVAGSKKQLVPRGIQNIAESSVDFVRNSIIMQTIGPDGLGYLPLLATMFFFIFFSNITEILPGIQMPANARFGMPLMLALMVWVIYWAVGFIKQGPAALPEELDRPARACRRSSCRSSRSSSSCRSSSCGPSRRRSDSSPTCWRATSSS